MKFYPPKMTRMQAGYQYAQFCQDYAISGELVINPDLFYERIGRKPFGPWMLHCISPDKIVWIPREFKDTPEEWLKYNTPPFRHLKGDAIQIENQAVRENIRASLQWEQADTHLRAVYLGGRKFGNGIRVDLNRFPSYESFRATVGLRPTKDHFLTTTDHYLTNKKRSMTPENFVWATKDALRAARAEAKTRYPRMESAIAFLGVEYNPTNLEPREAIQTKIIQRQITNDRRFDILIEPLLEVSQRRVDYNEALKEKEKQLILLQDKMREHLASKGYTGPFDLFNPNVLPRETHPKFNEARDLMNMLLRETRLGYAEFCRRESAMKIHERNRQAKAALDPIASANRHHTGKRGRPMERFVKAKVRISSLTPEQRKLLNLEPHQQEIGNPLTGRSSKFVEVMVPNPKLKNDTPSAEIADKTPNDSSLAA